MPETPPTPPQVGQFITIEALEREHIRIVIETAPSLHEAALILGIDPATLYRKRKRYALN